MRAGVVSRTDAEKALETTKQIIAYLESQGVDVVVETDTALALELEDHNTNLQDLDGDFVITVGGDGTILRAAMEMRTATTPIFGVNMGRRGFLSEVPPEGIEHAIQKVLDGDYFIEDSLKVKSWGLGITDVFPDALNEVLIASSLPSKMLLLRLSIDGEFITDIQADGAIISSPTGSTAYNMSAGGAIVAPTVDALSLTVICPYSYFRSLVFPASSTVRIELLKPQTDGMAIIDGRSYIALKPGSVVEATMSESVTRFIRFKPFYSRIQKRLMHLQTS
ncbi:MAG: NAD(+)/NADH kinase [Candidatus Bathyarchaeota archaeon]|nr:NAD(+)/NADH kinase [Candidatus Bathyarchaeota archaeon]